MMYQVIRFGHRGVGVLSTHKTFANAVKAACKADDDNGRIYIVDMDGYPVTDDGKRSPRHRSLKPDMQYGYIQA